MRVLQSSILFAASIVAGSPASAATGDFAETAALVTDYILKVDYPELFEDKPYRVKIENLTGADLDGDGQAEIVVQFVPHYRQSPTIVIYRVDRDRKVTRVKEAFAPGPLVRVDGSQLDGHSLGQAVDFSVAGQIDEEKRGKVAVSAMKNFGMVVAYPGFFHADGRSGGGAFIDLTGRAVPGGANDCSSFQFSTVRATAVGRFPAGGAPAIVAWIGGQIHVIRVRAFRDDGLIDESVAVSDAPAGFAGFEPGDALRFRTVDGKVSDLVEPAPSH